MESLAYTHLALACEEPSSLAEISNIEAFDLLTKLSLLSLLKQQKIICKAWLYGLSLSLTFIPFSETLALHQAEHQEQVNNLASNPNSKTILESVKSSFSNGNEKTQLSIPSSKKNEPQKIVLVKGDEEKVNLTNLVDTSPSIQTTSTIQPIQKTQNQVSVSNPNYQAEPTQVFSTILAMLETPSNSNTEPEFEATTEPEQKGKLRIVNDTPYIGIVALYKPGRKYPYRYAHIPACHKRELLATYSNHWQVNFNNGDISSVSKVSTKDGNFFEIKTSKLTGEESWINSCEEASKSQPVKLNQRKEPIYYTQEREQLSNMINTHKSQTPMILEKYSVLMQSLINENLRFVEYFSSDKDDIAVYCVLEKFLNEMIAIYNAYNRHDPNHRTIQSIVHGHTYIQSFSLDGKGDDVEVQLLFALEVQNKDKFFSDSIKSLGRNEIRNLIGYIENYIITRRLFYNLLGQPKIVVNNSSSGFTPASTTRNYQVKDINAECKVRVESGYQKVRIESGHQIVSEPSKKAKNC